MSVGINFQLILKPYDSLIVIQNKYHKSIIHEDKKSYKKINILHYLKLFSKSTYVTVQVMVGFSHNPANFWL